MYAISIQMWHIWAAQGPTEYLLYIQHGQTIIVIEDIK